MKEPWKVTTSFCLYLQSKHFSTLINIHKSGRGLYYWQVVEGLRSRRQASRTPTSNENENAVLALPSLLGLKANRRFCFVLLCSLSLLKQKKSQFLFPENPDPVLKWGLRSPDFEKGEDSLDSRPSPPPTGSSVLARKCPRGPCLRAAEQAMGLSTY